MRRDVVSGKMWISYLNLGWGWGMGCMILRMGMGLIFLMGFSLDRRRVGVGVVLVRRGGPVMAVVGSEGWGGET